MIKNYYNILFINSNITIIIILFIDIHGRNHPRPPTGVIGE